METPRPVAALYVQTGGSYFDRPGVDPWDVHRDARRYDGPHPVVAHPPCGRWGRFWAGSPSVIAATGERLDKGDDEGCFAAALAAVRKFGGVLEHPRDSGAWAAHGLNAPPHNGGWVVADWEGGWTCCVDQAHYGHRAGKATWLYAGGVDLPSLEWGRCKQRRLKLVENLCTAERLATPSGFRDLLLSIARTAQ